MDRLTRKELKTDKFAAEVGHTVQFLDRHRKEATIAGGVILAVLIAAAVVYFVRQGQHQERQAALREAVRTYQAQVAPPNPYIKTFATVEEKQEAITKVMTELAATFPGSDEASVASFYLGAQASDQGRLEDAEKHLQGVVENGSSEYASQAALSLASVYEALGRREEAEKLLRDLIEDPTVLVSKEQATISLAQLLAESDPEEARKLLEPLRSQRGAVSRSALSVLGSMQTGVVP